MYKSIYMSGKPAQITGSFEDLHPEEATIDELDRDDATNTPVEDDDSKPRSTPHENHELIPEANRRLENPACTNLIPSGTPGCLATGDQIGVHEDAMEENNAIVPRLQNIIERLEGELQKYKTDLLYARQEHFTSITRKREEIDELRKEHADEMDQLRNTITRLEEEVLDRNRLGIENRSLLLNYKASVKELTMVKTELELLTTDRNDQHTTAKRMENDVARLTAESNNLRHRNDDLNKSIALLTNEYKEEILKLNRENEALKLELVPRQQGSLEHSARRIAHGSLIQTPLMSTLLLGSLDNGNYSKSEVEQAAKPEVRLSRYDPTLSSPFMRVKRFKIEPSQVMHCRNCGMVSDGIRAHAHRKCSFHAAAPQPYQVWKKSLDSAKCKAAARDHQGDKFWPCCEIISRHEPPGCKVLRHHDLVRLRDPED